MLATIGCAAGLGNIWRFSYVAGENGGGAFLLIYLACVMLLGVPLMLGEFCIGRRAQADVVESFAGKLSGSGWGLAGWLMAIASLVLLSYYAVIAGWAYKYFADYVIGATSDLGSGQFADYFESFVADPLQPVVWQFLVVASTVAVVIGGVQHGIELVNKILMPLLGAIVIILRATRCLWMVPVPGLRSCSGRTGRRLPNRRFTWPQSGRHSFHWALARGRC